MRNDELLSFLGWTALHRAAFRGEVDVARALLDGGADLAAAALDGWSAIQVACLEGRASVARLLHERGAGVEGQLHALQPLMLACASGDLETARVFARERADPRGAALFFLAAHDRAGHEMRKLTDAGDSDGDMVGYSTSWNERWAVRALTLELDDDVMAWLGDTVTPLEDGLCVGGVDVVRAGNAVSFPNAPPAGLCGDYYRHVYVVELAPHLLGDRALPIERLRALLCKAVYARHTPVIDALLPETGKPADALFAAISIDDAEIVARLVDDPNVKQPRPPRYTALQAAAAYAKPRAASALLEKGARVEGDRRETPLLLAVEKTGDAALDVVIALLEHGADVEARHPTKRWTPLMRAALAGDARIVERLLRAGADPNARDKAGQTALRYAELDTRRKEHSEIVELLRGFE